MAASRFSEMFKEDFLYFDDSSDEEDAGDLLPVNPSPSSKTKATTTKAAITRDSEVADEKVSAHEQTMPEVQPQTRTNARTKANIVARLKWKTANKNCSASSPSQSRAETKKEVRSSHVVPANDGPSQDSKPKGSRRELKTLDDTVSDTEVPRTPILRTYSRAQNRAIADEGSSSTGSPRTPILSALQASIVPLTRCNGGQSEERKASGSPQVVSSMDDIIVSYEGVESAHKPRPISRKKVGVNTAVSYFLRRMPLKRSLTVFSCKMAKYHTRLILFGMKYWNSLYYVSSILRRTTSVRRHVMRTYNV